jgi:hypothetical protein
MRTSSIIAGLALVVTGSIAGCSSTSSSGAPGGSSSSPPALANSVAGKAAATAQIKANYRTFFDTSTPRSTSVGLLENGPQLTAAIKLAAHVAKVEKTKESAVVTKVTFTDPTHANVTYNLLGTPLRGSTGKAVLVDGTWKVSQTTFCTLADLGAQTIGQKAPAGC